MCVWVKFYGGSKLRLNTVRHVTSIGPSITPVSTITSHMWALPYLSVSTNLFARWYLATFHAAIRYWVPSMLPSSLSPSVRLLRDISCTFNPFPLRRRDMVFLGGGVRIYIYTLFTQVCFYSFWARIYVKLSLHH